MVQILPLILHGIVLIHDSTFKSLYHLCSGKTYVYMCKIILQVK